MRDVRRGAGEFDVRVTINRLKADATVNAAGHIDESSASNWETYATRWCQVVYQKGDEVIAGDQLIAHRFPVLRFVSDSSTRSFTTGMRAVLGDGRTFSFAEPPRDVKERRGEVEVACVEVPA